MTIVADRTNDLHQKCFVSVRLLVSPFYSSMLGVSMLGVLGLHPSHKEFGFLYVLAQKF